MLIQTIELDNFHVNTAKYNLNSSKVALVNSNFIMGAIVSLINIVIYNRIVYKHAYNNNLPIRITISYLINNKQYTYSITYTDKILNETLFSGTKKIINNNTSELKIYKYRAYKIFENFKVEHVPCILTLLNNKFKIFIDNILPLLDLGISKTELIQLNFEEYCNNLNLDADVYKNILNTHKYYIFDEYTILRKKENNYIITRLNLYHQAPDEKCVLFDIDEESNGLKQLLYILPYIYETINSDKICLLPNIDNSLHPVLITALLNNIDTPNQLIFSINDRILKYIDNNIIIITS